MKLDLLYEIQMPEPWEGERYEYKKFWETIEQAEMADRMGFDTMWFVEHHGLVGFAHSSAPEVVLSAISQRTKDIRIGHGVVLLPGNFNHPIRVAERVATLDILSNGRVEFGTGRSSHIEQEAFGINPADSRAMWQEALRIIPRMWTESPFKHEGKFYKIPERTIVPKPLQKPHPRMWLAATGPESWELAGQNGIGVLGMVLLTGVEELMRRVDVYHKAIKTCTPAGKFINDEIGVFTIVNCAETTKQAYANGGGDAAMFYIDYAAKGFARLEQMGQAETKIYQDLKNSYPLIQKIAHGEVTVQDLEAEDMILIGDPDHCIRKIEKYEKAGFQRLLCLMQSGRLEHQHIIKSLELFGKHVIPHFKAKERRKQTAVTR
jgi:alkanesulfonate monooxygenase SsuD/methylene tetrahydromethanopterin reductase-like flavin-dependent oxidoreductase (luciferase family)